MEKFCWKGHASMLGANTMWGLMSPLSKLLMAGGAVTPLVVTDLRIGGAMVLFWIASFFQKPEHVNHKDLITLFFASLFAIVFNQGCFIFGVSLSSPLGIACGAGGALLLILGSSQNQPAASSASHTAIWGDLLVLFAQFCYAFYIVRFKDFVNKYSLITIMKWMFTYSFICTIPFSASDLMNADWGGLKAVEIGSLTFIVVGATFVSYMLIVVGQKNLRPTVAGMYNYIQPLVACIVAVCWGMDSFNTTKIIAVVLIFGGVYLVTSSRSRKEMEAYKQAERE